MGVKEQNDYARRQIKELIEEWDLESLYSYIDKKDLEEVLMKAFELGQTYGFILGSEAEQYMAAKQRGDIL